MAQSFKDLFSGGSADYARFRPRYPPELFAWLAEVSPTRALALDVGTGNGQAAVALAGHFERVIGIEASASQLASAKSHERVSYQQGPAEALQVPGGVADLLLVAQAFHWFEAQRFFTEAARVLRPGGVLALVSYGNCTVSPAVDAAVFELYETRLGRFWEPERRLVESGYAGVRPPRETFAETLAPPALVIAPTLSCDEFLGYLGTWSALAKCRKEARSAG